MQQIRYAIFILYLACTVFTGCKKDCDVTAAVVVDAGDARLAQLPVDSIALTGEVKAGLTPNTVYLWTLISGPSVPVFSHNDAAVTSVKSLVAGTYLLQFQATNNAGSLGLDTVSIIVTAPDIKTLSLQPQNSDTEGNPDSYFPAGNGSGTTQLSANAWTRGGLPENDRIFIKFDYSGIPVGATVTSATLTLSATLTPQAGNYVDAHFGPTNACDVFRITSPWDISTLNWTNQPGHTTQNAALIPQSTSSYQTDVVDVTELVKDMIATTNYGFAIMLHDEVVYNSRQYASSFYPDAVRRPKLEIMYQ